MIMRHQDVRIADIAQRYWELTRLIADAKRTADELHDELAAWIRETGAPVEVEGMPALRLVLRRNGRCWDLRAFAQHEPREFQRLVDLGCLTVQAKLAQEHERAGNVSGIHRRFSWETHTEALVFDRISRGSRR